MDFTSKQLQYLFYLDLYQNSCRLISDLAEQLKVSKAAVSQVLDVYEKKASQASANGITLAGAADRSLRR